MSQHDYRNDTFGMLALNAAADGKASTVFGAVLVTDTHPPVTARNRRSEHGENDLLGGGVDYAIHAEQAAIAAALRAGIDPRDATIYVLGRVNRGPRAGRLSVRGSDDDRQFSCPRCARTMQRFGVNVAIPLPSGWYTMSADSALEGALAFKAARRERVFAAC